MAHSSAEVATLTSTPPPPLRAAAAPRSVVEAPVASTVAIVFASAAVARIVQRFVRGRAGRVAAKRAAAAATAKKHRSAAARSAAAKARHLALRDARMEREAAAAEADALTKLDALRTKLGGETAIAPLLCEPAVVDIITHLCDSDAAADDVDRAELAEGCRATARRLVDATDPVHAELLGWRVWRQALRLRVAKPARTPFINRMRRALLAPLRSCAPAAAVLRRAFDLDVTACASHARAVELKQHAVRTVAAATAVTELRRSTVAAASKPPSAAQRAKRRARRKAQKSAKKEARRQRAAAASPPPSPSRAGISTIGKITFLALFALLAALALCGAAPTLAASGIKGAAPASAESPSTKTKTPLGVVDAAAENAPLTSWVASFQDQMYLPLSQKLHRASGALSVLVAVGVADVAGRRGGAPAAVRAMLVVLANARSVYCQMPPTMTGSGSGSGSGTFTGDQTMTGSTATTGDQTMTGSTATTGDQTMTGSTATTGDQTMTGSGSGTNTGSTATTGDQTMTGGGSATTGDKSTNSATTGGSATTSGMPTMTAATTGGSGSGSGSGTTGGPGAGGDSTPGPAPITGSAFTWTGGNIQNVAGTDQNCIQPVAPDVSGYPSYRTDKKQQATISLAAGKSGSLYFKGTTFKVEMYACHENGCGWDQNPTDYIEIAGTKHSGTPTNVPQGLGATFTSQDSFIWKVEATNNYMGMNNECYQNGCAGFQLCLCDTSQGYHVVDTDGTCKAFGLSSCPTGYWGDASSTQCVACDANAGKVAIAGTGFTTEATACAQAAFTISGSGVEYSGVDCVTDGSGMYSSGEDATMSLNIAGQLYVKQFQLPMMSGSDFIELFGQQYFDQSGPSGVVVAAGTAMQWKTMWGGYEGFEICVCDISKAFQAVVLGDIPNTVADACTAYTATTCPTGHWGDTATSRCVPCDIGSGKTAKPGTGHTTEAAACAQAAFTFTGGGVEYDGFDCIKSKSATKSVYGYLSGSGYGTYYYQSYRESTPISASITAVISGMMYHKNTATRTLTSTNNYLCWKSGKKSTTVGDPTCSAAGSSAVSLSETTTGASGSTVCGMTGVESAIRTEVDQVTIKVAECNGMSSVGNTQFAGGAFGTDTYASHQFGSGSSTTPTDSLVVKGTTYHGSNGPGNMDVTIGDSILWNVGSSSMYSGSTCGSNDPSCLNGFTLCVCNTNIEFKVLTVNGCETFSLTTCPAGFWGDVDLSRCVACDADAGRSSNGAIGAQSEGMACKSAALLYSGTGVEYDATNAMCVTDGPGAFGPSEKAVITANVGGKLYTKMQTQDYQEIVTTNIDLDYLFIQGAHYGGYSSLKPDGISVVKNELMAWSTYYGGTGGFTLCICPIGDGSEENKYWVLNARNQYGQNSECTQYSETTCPGGYWGDAVTKGCIACAGGKWSVRMTNPGTTSESAECTGSCPAGKTSAVLAATSLVEAKCASTDATFNIDGTGIMVTTDASGNECFKTVGSDGYTKKVLLGSGANIVVQKAGTLFVKSSSWDTGAVTDWSKGDTLTIQGFSHAGSTFAASGFPATGIIVPAGETLVWASDPMGYGQGFEVCLCDTSSSFKAVTSMGSCDEHSGADCPMGHWKDVPNSLCVACDRTKGRVADPNNMLSRSTDGTCATEIATGATAANPAACAEERACKTEAFLILGSGIVAAEDTDSSNNNAVITTQCIKQDGSYIAENKKAVITNAIAGPLYTVGEWDLNSVATSGEACIDYLKIGSTKYSETKPAAGTAVKAGGTMEWDSGSRASSCYVNQQYVWKDNKNGFKLCLCGADYTIMTAANVCEKKDVDTCPSGSWGDAATATCSLCPAGKWGQVPNKKTLESGCPSSSITCPAGKHSNLQPGMTTMSKACTPNGFSTKGSGLTIDANDALCLSDGVGNYAANKNAVATVLLDGDLYFPGAFKTGNIETDFLTINGVTYGGTSSPQHGIIVKKTDEISWVTGGNYDKMFAGFKMCICPTDGPYTVLKGSTCTEYTKNTCPAGRYASAPATKKCLACPRGKFGTKDKQNLLSQACPGSCPQGKFGSRVAATSMAEAACSSTWTFNGTGIELDGNDCFSEGAGIYAANQYAEIKALKGGALYTVGAYETKLKHADAEIGEGSGAGSGSGSGSGATGATASMATSATPDAVKADPLDYIGIKGTKYGGWNAPPDGLQLAAGELIFWKTRAGGGNGFKMCICDTGRGYKALVNKKCVQFSAGNCPTGHWEDVSGERCVPCDVLGGRVGTGDLSATTESSACKTAAFTIRGLGVQRLGDACITDGPDKYGVSEDASMTVVADGKLFSVGTFRTGDPLTPEGASTPVYNDYLKVNGIKFGGSIGPFDGMRMRVGDKLQWRTGATITPSNYVNYEGFTLCICDTDAPYKTLVGTTCSVLTSTTCPADHYGDVTAQKCASCGARKVSPASSTSIAACICAKGSYGAGGINECTPCGPGATSVEGSSAQSACTCMAGYYGQPGEWCTPCNGGAGRVSNGLPGKTTESDACKAASFSISGSHLELTYDDCVTDGAGNTGQGEAGTATSTVAGSLYAIGTFSVGSADTLSIAGTKYATKPTNAIAFAEGDNVAWSTSYQMTYGATGMPVTYTGFKLCFCATSSPYTLLDTLTDPPTCGAYTATTCPAGFWGDSVSQTCAACPTGKFGSGANQVSLEAGCTDCPTGKFGIETGKNSSETACIVCPPWGVNDTVLGATACRGAAYATSRWVQAARPGDSCNAACLRDSGTNAVCNEARGALVNSKTKFLSVVDAIKASRGNAAPAFNECPSYVPAPGVGYVQTPGQWDACGFMNAFDTFSCAVSQSTATSASALSTTVRQLCCCPESGEDPVTACPVEATDCSAGMAFVEGQCLTCTPGRFSTAGSTTCTDCGLGYYAQQPMSTTCTACEFDTVTGINFQAHNCTSCETGTVRDAAAVFCTACAAGKAKNVALGVCEQCETYEYAAPASEECRTCNEGAVPDTAKAACEQCRVGTYAAPRALACNDCGFQGMDCSGGKLKLVSGWWYDESDPFTGTTAVYECLNPLACDVANGTVLQCPENAAGPLCAVCETGYVPDAGAVNGACKECPSSLVVRWTNKGLLMALGAAVFFGIAMIVLTRPVPALKIDRFLVAVNVRVIIRRARKRILKKLHEREREAPGSKITRDQSVKYVDLVNQGKIDEVIVLRRQMAAAHNLGNAVAVANASIGHDVDIDNLAVRGVEAVDAMFGDATREMMGEEDVETERVGGVILNAHESLGGGGGDGGGDGGGAPDALPEGADAEGGLGGGALGEGVAQAQQVAADAVEQTQEMARDAAAAAREAAEGAKSGATAVIEFIRTEGNRLVEQIRNAYDPGSIKILMGNLQINASLTVVFEIPWPPVFTRFIAFMSIFKLDVFKGLSFAAPCLHSSHFMSLASFVATPAVLIGVFFTAFVVVALVYGAVHLMPMCCQTNLRKLPCGRYTVSSARTAALKVAIIVILFIYPTICSKVFMTFKCVDVGPSGQYMVADMSVKCFSTEWLIWAAVAVCAMLFYIVGIPVVLVLLLWCGARKGTLQYPATELSSESVIHSHEVVAHVRQTNDFFNNRLAFGNLYLQYEPKYWWFEFCCTMRKMILTGALVLFGAGTAPQVVTALVVCIMWFGLVANLQPFINDTDDQLAQVEGLQVLFTLMIGLVLQLEQERAKAAGSDDEGNELGIILIILNVVVIALALVQQPICRKIIMGVLHYPTQCMLKYRAKHEWAKVVLAAPSDAEFAQGKSDKFDWVNSHTLEIIPIRPRALVAPNMASVQTKARKRRESGVWGKHEVFHFDFGTGEPIVDFLHARGDDGSDIWINQDTQRVMKKKPLELIEVNLFSESTHWLDGDTGELLSGRPVLVEDPLPPLCFCFARHQHGEFASVWRSHYTGKLRDTDPKLDFVKKPKKKKKKGCCGKKKQGDEEEVDEDDVVIVEVDAEEVEVVSIVEAQVQEQLMKSAIEQAASAHVRTKNSKLLADERLRSTP